MTANVLENGRAGRRAFVAGAACALAGLSGRAFGESRSLKEGMQGDVAPVHDPCIIKRGDAFYVFSTTSRPGPGDTEHDGRPTLRISRITWTADGWPQAQL